jgi:hypothetical protein
VAGELHYTVYLGRRGGGGPGFSRIEVLQDMSGLGDDGYPSTKAKYSYQQLELTAARS